MTPIRTTYYQPSTKEIPRTGVITTSGVGVVDATPTSFTAHVEWRNDSHEIFDKMLAGPSSRGIPQLADFVEN
jgi:alkaline phosphatase